MKTILLSALVLLVSMDAQAVAWDVARCETRWSSFELEMRSADGRHAENYIELHGVFMKKKFKSASAAYTVFGKALIVQPVANSIKRYGIHIPRSLPCGKPRHSFNAFIFLDKFPIDGGFIKTLAPMKCWAPRY